MEKKRTIFDYMGQVFMIFGITMVVLNIFCILFGESAKDYSQMFSLGNQGLSVQTALQFFLVSICITTLRFLFFTDLLLKRMSILWRTVLMVLAVVIVIGVFIVVCGWFPVNMWMPWLLFFLSFGISFGISMAVTIWKERIENRKMAEALERLKEEENQ